MADKTAQDILEHLLSSYPGTRPVEAWGEQAVFYNPEGRLPRGVYFATLKARDGKKDTASNLDRPDIFRLNIGTTRRHFEALFGPPPPRPAKGGVVAGSWDFTVRDRITPHPVYGWMGWISVLNPGAGTLRTMRPMIDAAYDKAVATFDRRAGRP